MDFPSREWLCEAALHQVANMIGRISNGVLSVCAGVSSFIFTLLGYLLLTDLNEQLVGSLFIGLFALLVVWVASEKPNSGQARAMSALVDRLMQVGSGDLASPAPAVVREEMPAVASAVEGLLKQVQSNIENVHAMAMYDPVTSLPNRVHFKREADRILQARTADDNLALLFIDLDGFKEVNDSLGHAQGDQTLALVATRLRAVVKAETEEGELVHPLVARLAGDEFTLLFPSLSGAAEAKRIAHRVIDTLRDTFELGDQKIRLGASIGIALCPEHGTGLTGLMRAADTAMYHAKAAGRSRASIYDASLSAAAEEKAQIERELARAIARGEFQLVFHPQLAARSDDIVAGEALVRWNNPVSGVMLPDAYIHIAEDSGLISEIGDWVIGQAAQVLVRWQAAGMPQRLCINISARQADQPEFFARLRRTMNEAGASLERLELEFTETLAMRCSDEVMNELVALRSDGVSITVDDFGSGYSNLARMKDMPIDRVKLDSALTDDIDRCETTRIIVSSVIHLVHGLGAEVVAEGVGRPEQLDVLRALGCDLVQGHAFAEPMGETEFMKWVGSRSSVTPKAMIA